MKERPIPFTAESVRAILAGKKTMTRRVVKPQPTWPWDQPPVWVDEEGYYHSGTGSYLGTKSDVRSPYGVPGDLLWVRETWGFSAQLPLSAHNEASWLAYPDLRGYKADTPDGNWCWRSSLFMPRWASRLTLRVTSVRCERLQEINEWDVLEKGIDVPADGKHSNRVDFAQFWDTINARRGYSWESNPFVWVVSFEVQSCR